MLRHLLREARVGIAGEHHQAVKRGAVHPGVHRGHGLWLGRKDSNPRMAESKSAALTSLATPQLMLFIRPSHRAGGGRAPAPRIRPCLEASGIESHALRILLRTRRRRTLRNPSCVPARLAL